MTDTGERTILEGLRGSMMQNRLPHAFIIVGKDDDSRMRFAKDFAKLLFAADEQAAGKIDGDNYEDLIFVRKDGDSVKVHQIESLAAALKNKPYYADRMMAVVADGDVMTEYSQNKLLKTLEEPNPGNVILILTSNPERLYITVRSRCVTLKLPDSPPKISVAVRDDAKALLSLTMFGKRPLQEAFDKIDAYCGELTDAANLLSAMEVFLRDLAVGAYEGELVWDESNRPIALSMKKQKHFSPVRYISLIEEARSDLDRGVNKRNRMRDMMIRFRQEALHD
ncbi:MAG: hypothetical protein LBQ21_01730 [Clostridiales Family XIII bacterium]|jgi:DNA polymerase III delta prime subunit|nr:hypothetical protein [Clostridiales Family XIII bacterium]